jgi:glyoxylate utilization-related uncharacterized protein
MSCVPLFENTDVQFLGTPEIGVRFTICEFVMKPDGGTTQPIADELEPFVFIVDEGAELTVMRSLPQNSLRIWVCQFTLTQVHHYQCFSLV